MFDRQRFYLVKARIEEHKCPTHPATMTDPACCETCNGLDERIFLEIEERVTEERLGEHFDFDFEELDCNPVAVNLQLDSMRRWLTVFYPSVLEAFDARIGREKSDANEAGCVSTVSRFDSDEMKKTRRLEEKGILLEVEVKNLVETMRAFHEEKAVLEEQIKALREVKLDKNISEKDEWVLFNRITQNDTELEGIADPESIEVSYPYGRGTNGYAAWEFRLLGEKGTTNCYAQTAICAQGRMKSFLSKPIRIKGRKKNGKFWVKSIELRGEIWD